MNPLELIELSGDSYFGQFIEQKPGMSEQDAITMINDLYTNSCVSLAARGLVPIDKPQIIFHSAKQNQEVGYGPNATYGWKQKFERSVA